MASAARCDLQEGGAGVILERFRLPDIPQEHARERLSLIMFMTLTTAPTSVQS